ncbi:MAG: hypothetical protein AB7V08_05085 [Elusimicrobiales bacterium]
MEGKDGLAAYRAFRAAQANINSREIAALAGKFRNPIKTAIQIEKRNEALVDILKASSLGALEPMGAHAYARIYEDCSFAGSH